MGTTLLSSTVIRITSQSASYKARAFTGMILNEQFFKTLCTLLCSNFVKARKVEIFKMHNYSRLITGCYLTFLHVIIVTRHPTKATAHGKWSVKKCAFLLWESPIYGLSWTKITGLRVQKAHTNLSTSCPNGYTKSLCCQPMHVCISFENFN